MQTLAIDTALTSCSVAIVSGDETLFEEILPLAKGHAEMLPPMVARALSTARVKAVDVNRLGVVVGPGQFTGVRVGLAFARGFALGRPNSIVGIDSLRGLHATHARDGEWCAAVVDARRGEVFCALYDPSGEEVLSPVALSPNSAGERILSHLPTNTVCRLVGSGATLVPSTVNLAAAKDTNHINPRAVADIASSKSVPSEPPGPIYLRAPDAKPSAAPLFAGMLTI
ncbi:MAG: tRNA (adenosine(37)-N6)-threonylcarbamoyltransferase complex dimerization subunit type 1 TsaB [Pseudomonadota bacterium]